MSTLSDDGRIVKLSTSDERGYTDVAFYRTTRTVRIDVAARDGGPRVQMHFDLPSSAVAGKLSELFATAAADMRETYGRSERIFDAVDENGETEESYADSDWREMR
jgi:histidinol phosphatase-like PHP family hydrolase